MASLLKKIWSNLDFWDRDENRRQNEDFRREDEEERRRREQQRRSSQAVRQPGPHVVVGPTIEDDAGFDLKKPLLKVASQSDFAKKQPDVKVEVDPQQEMDKLIEQNRAEALEKERRGTNLLTRLTVDRNWRERAEVAARTKAVRQYQEKHGFNKQPEVMATLGETNRIGQELSKKSAKVGEYLKGVEDRTVKAAEVASYVPVAGSVLNLGMAGMEKLQKANGDTAAGNATAEQRLRIDLGMKQEEFDRLDPETKNKLRTLQNVGLAASPLDFLGLGGLAKAGVVGTGKTAAKQLIKEGAVDVATKQALKKAAKTTAKEMGVATVAGTGLTLGAQGYLGGKDQLNAAEALKTGLMVGGTSLLMPSQGNRRLSKAVNVVDDDAAVIPGATKGAGAPDAIEVAPGVKSTNLPKAAAAAEEANRQIEVTTPTVAGAAPDAPIDVPIPTRNVPDVTNPIALAKADPNMPVTSTTSQPELPMADFSKSINAPLAKAPLDVPRPVPVVEQTPTDIAEAAAAGDLRVPTRIEVDAAGNPVMVSDVEAGRAMVDEGVAPVRADSPVAVTEGEMADAAAQAVREEVNPDAVAPRTRQQITNRISDDDLRADLTTNAPVREKVSLEEAELKAKAFINDLSDEALVGRFAGEVSVSDPAGWFSSMNAIRRLEQIDTPEAQQAIRNALDAMAEYSSQSGRGMRTVQTVFEDMPTTMKHDYLVNRIEKKIGQELPDVERQQLLYLIERSDEATGRLRALENEAAAMLESGVINNASMSPETKARVSELNGLIKKTAKEKEILSGDAYRFYTEQAQRGQGKTPLGKRTADVGRTLMLSSPTGRGFDILSTFTTAADDLITRGISGLIGKGVNLVKGRGTVSASMPNAGKLLEGGIEGLGDVKDSWKGTRRVEDFMTEASKASRGDIDAGGSGIRQKVRALVEAPTKLTRGLRNDELFRQGMDEAAQQGLRGDAQRAYAELRSAIPDETQLRQAEQAHMRANMLHDNPVSRQLNSLANALDARGGGWGATLIRNQVAPFTSWLGGNLHRTLTDKNVLWNVGSAINNIRKGNAQGAIDDISKFAVNTGEAYAAGYLLTQAGVLTTEDANGDSYGGLYFHIGDRYIPVAVAGTMSVPIILGNAASQGVDAMNETGDVQDMFATLVNEAGRNTLKNAGVASVFGGENNLQQAVDTATREGGDLFDAAAQYAGGIVRQFIPGVTGDVNAVLDQTALNPTGEAADTKVTFENPETGRENTDVMGTELMKTVARIPFAAQGLPRKEGQLAKDLLDRMLRSTREGDAKATEREGAESLKDMERRLRREGVPLKDEAIKGALDDGDYDKATRGLEYKLAKAEADPDASESSKDKIRTELMEAQLQRDDVPLTKEGILARAESGEYDKAIRGANYQLEKMKNDKDTPKSKLEDAEKEVTRLEVTRDGDFPPEVIDLYSKTEVSEWRAMGNPDHEDYDPDVYQMLWAYDEALAEKGASRSKKDGSKQKFTAAKGRGGRGGSGGRGGKSGAAKGFTTDIAMQKFGGADFSPQKVLAANFASPESAIPVLQKVPNYDRSKLKKITVSKGGRG